MLQALRGWTPVQKKVVAASFLGWMLDAFDFFLLVFVLSDVAHEFGVERDQVFWAITLTLALRPLGAFIFGRLADHYGRRPILMINVSLFALFGFLTAFAPSLAVFLVIRSLFGIAMGGEWGIGASLAMETVRPDSRGLVSGLLQSGYPAGYLLASLVYAALFDVIGWRGMFMISFLPALLVLYIRRHVPESPAWSPDRGRAGGILQMLGAHWLLALYAIVLMTAFNFFSHGTQDIYPTFLRVQHGLDARTTGTIAIIYNVGAILGGWTFGIWSQQLGRRRAILIAALLALPVSYLWAFSTTFTTLAVGAFLMQFCVQGAWGVIPAHLTELSPANARATFPGTVYQLGNFLASWNANLQGWIAASQGDNYGLALASVAIAAALAIALLIGVSREGRDVVMS
jgi:SHS family lactate transporter-like MFS transporter